MISFLYLDETFFKGGKQSNCHNFPIWTIHYPKGNVVKYSNGKINRINEYQILYITKTDFGSSGCPIINKGNFKVIGINKGYIKEYIKEFGKKINIGILIKSTMEDLQLYIEKNKSIINISNKIRLSKENIYLNISQKENNIKYNFKNNNNQLIN